ncbi:UDP-N-acetylglucosamine 2-epimerase [Legionella clemsonensis]|uniref:UDP-N,N'-diacetylbacillosamine 2-epimerase (Hydrolyzing) n=1 Tax=Legionella clemsonensis TaxID=1867846 RepID=A0A222P3K6_9GAMM|nr:UDP-N-acetylglucosamine 2-epimerase [Legionella clemsonensis]ASQ46440.1 UDP-N,N'-diacetylbacillosamine 2-epimerase (hydrolyzing) [Legionella clemsonensis]
MRSVLKCLNAAPDIDLSICVTGMHLSALYGSTVNEIIADGFKICAQIPVDVNTAVHATMAKSIGFEIIAMTELFEQQKPDIVLLLGDRGEMLAGALAAVHLNIPVVHLHGGERSGTVDEMIRHAISKLAHYHFVATKAAYERLVKMGERENSIFLVGAPGLDEIVTYNPCNREQCCKQYGLDPSRPFALLIFHPVVQEYNEIRFQFENIILAALQMKLQILILEPNSDAGGHFIREILEKYKNHEDVRVIKHMLRQSYLDCLANADVMLGNSSSGIIEAASYNLIVINVGSRQQFRERGDNVIDVGTDIPSILSGLHQVLPAKKNTFNNFYGDGRTAERCCELLRTISLNPDILNKCNAY